MENKRKNEFLPTFTVLWSVFSMVYFVVVTFLPIPESGKSFANTVLGFLIGTAVSTMISFWYGSSQASKQKDATIASMAQTPPAPQTIPADAGSLPPSSGGSSNAIPSNP